MIYALQLYLSSLIAYAPRSTDMAGDAVMREVTLALPMVPEMEIEASKTATAIAESIRHESG